MKKYFTLLLFLFSINAFSQNAKIKWLTFQEAEELNKKQPKKILIDVYTNWCGWCKKMDAETFTNPLIIDYVNKYYYAVKLNAEMKDSIVVNGKTYKNPGGPKASHELAVALLNGKMSYPSFVYLDEGFNMLTPVPGYQTPKDLEPILKYFGENAYQSMKWPEYQKVFVSGLK
jgi:thioredoxin-related protein